MMGKNRVNLLLVEDQSGNFIVMEAVLSPLKESGKVLAITTLKHVTAIQLPSRCKRGPMFSVTGARRRLIFQRRQGLVDPLHQGRVVGHIAAVGDVGNEGFTRRLERGVDSGRNIDRPVAAGQIEAVDFTVG